MKEAGGEATKPANEAANEAGQRSGPTKRANEAGQRSRTTKRTLQELLLPKSNDASKCGTARANIFQASRASMLIHQGKGRCSRMGSTEANMASARSTSVSG